MDFDEIGIGVYTKSCQTSLILLRIGPV